MAGSGVEVDSKTIQATLAAALVSGTGQTTLPALVSGTGQAFLAALVLGTSHMLAALVSGISHATVAVATSISSRPCRYKNKNTLKIIENTDFG